MEHVYLAIDLKSFYASVECVQRGLDPLKTNLVVADERRTEKTICLAVTPPLKAYGIPGRARLFEVIEKTALINAQRRMRAPGHRLCGESNDADALARDARLALSYIVAPPQMARYLQISAQIYQIYLRYIAPEDIHVYSIDEVFIDATHYLHACGLTPQELARQMILDVLHTTGITATAGIGTNLYLAKIAMDIGAKHTAPDENGVRICTLDELEYRKTLWNHRPLTDFWRVGRGTARKLEHMGLYTMGDVARCSLGAPDAFYNEALLYRLFGVNAELLIDHAWGWEPCTMAQIKAYRPSARSTGSGQVLQCPYPFDRARLAAREMADALALSLMERGLVTDQIVLHVGYDRENLDDPTRAAQYRGPVTTDGYGRRIPVHAHGSQELGAPCASARRITQAAMDIFDRVVDPALLVRRIYVTAGRVQPAHEAAQPVYEQLDLFADEQAQQAEQARQAREARMQRAMLDIQRKYGKNAILRGMNYQTGATMRERNGQIGGHRA